MNRPVRPSSTDVAVPLLAAAASFFTLLSWRGLAEDPSSYLVPLYWTALGVGVLGIALRALQLPWFLVPVAQVLATFLVLHQQWTSGGLLGGWLPTPDSLTVLREVLSLSVETTSRYAAPVPATEPMLAPVLVVAGAAVVLAADLLSATLRRAPLAGLPLLAAFTVAVSLLDGVSWITFALTAAAFVLLLAAEQAATLGRWGDRADHRADDAAGEGATAGPLSLGSLWPAAGRVGAVGVAAAVLAPVLVPAGDGWFGGGGGGVGPGGSGVSLDNPFVDIRRDLVQRRDVDLVSVLTDDPDPSYLRLTVLDDFDGDTWRPSERRIPPENRAEGELPLPYGLSTDTPTETYEWQIQVEERFGTTWLPTPYPALAVEADGDWRYDLDTLDLVSADEEDAAGLGYQASGLEVLPRPEALVAAGSSGRVLNFSNTRLPDGVPALVGELAREVTEGATSNFERATMLQRWFRSDGGFTYSLEPAPGNGVEDLERFLGTGPDSRVGYCEQFSAAMATMARSLGIPARVAVGFLSPERIGDQWVYSTRDLHAWPEIFFEGAGWVRFEPTPSVRTGEAPGYTVEEVAAPQQTAAPSVSPTAAAPSAADRRQAGDDAGSAGAGGSWLGGWLPWVGGLVALTLLALTPRALRSLVRRRRYAASASGAVVEGAWDEVRATAIDLGRGWDDGQTLRRRARTLTPLLGSDTEGVVARVALDRLVTLVERSRYSSGGLPDPLGDEARTASHAVREALRRAARPRAQRRATWLPASLWRGRSQQPRRVSEDEGRETGTVSAERVSL